MISRPRSHHGAVRVDAARQTVTPDAPAQADRGEAIAITASVFDRACAADGRTEAVLAALCEVSVTQLRAWRCPLSGRRAPLWALLTMRPEAVRVALDALLAWTDPHAAIVSLPDAAGPVDLATLAKATRETADVVASALDHHGRGHITRAEGAALERECDEAISVLLAIREQARTAVREGVVGTVRGPRGAA